MSRSIPAVLTIAVALALPQAPAASQDNTSITVTGPVRSHSGQPADGVQQRTRITSDVTVGFADLDLRSDYGRWVLAQRLRIAADEACDRIDEIDPPSAVGGVVHDDCRSLAMRRAEPQMRRAISAAG